MLPKRYRKFRVHHTYIRLRDYQTVRSPYLPTPQKEKTAKDKTFNRLLFGFKSYLITQARPALQRNPPEVEKCDRRDDFS